MSMFKRLKSKGDHLLMIELYMFQQFLSMLKFSMP